MEESSNSQKVDTILSNNAQINESSIVRHNRIFQAQEPFLKPENTNENLNTKAST